VSREKELKARRRLTDADALPLERPAAPPQGERPPYSHRIKSWPESFRAVVVGKKRFEIRRDDRTPRYEPGDSVLLREFDPVPVAGGELGTRPPHFTGRQALYFIGYVDRSEALPPGWCGFELVSSEDLNRVGVALDAIRGRL
jgi:hypothetical protein